MKKLFDEKGLLNTEDLIMNAPSFQKIVEDQVITEEEIREQSERVANILKEIEEKCNDEQIELVRNLLAEVSVFVAISRK
jgi:hypothetical protein